MSPHEAIESTRKKLKITHNTIVTVDHLAGLRSRYRSATPEHPMGFLTINEMSTAEQRLYLQVHSGAHQILGHHLFPGGKIHEISQRTESLYDPVGRLSAGQVQQHDKAELLTWLILEDRVNAGWQELLNALFINEDSIVSHVLKPQALEWRKIISPFVLPRFENNSW